MKWGIHKWKNTHKKKNKKKVRPIKKAMKWTLLTVLARNKKKKNKKWNINEKLA